MKITNAFFALTLTVMFSASLLTSSFETKAAEADLNAAIKAKLLKIGLQANKIEDAPIPGLKQILTNRGVFYTSADGQFFIAGRLFDIDAGMVNLTEEALADLRISGLNEFKDSMIVFPAKDEKYRVTVFTDTTCAYCKKMHSQMDEYNKLGITIQYLAFPRSGMNSRGWDEIQSVWCSADQQNAMTTAKNGEAIKPATCSAPIAAHYNLGQAAGVTGTPAIVFENGTMIPGYKPPQALLQDLSR